MRSLPHPDVLVGAAGATTALGVVLLDVARTSSTAIALAALVGALGAVLAAVGMLHGNRFEARLAAAVVAGTSVTLALVGMAVGPPGSLDACVSWRAGLVVATGAVALALVRLASSRGATRPPTMRPYAH